MSILLVVSAPSGAGKTTLCRRLLEKSPQFHYSISHTTRPPRTGEIDGRDYHFVSQETFRQMVEGKEFLEWAEVYGRCYGTGRAVVENQLQSGHSVLVDVDTVGARQIKASFPEAVLVFIVPPSLDELGRRLRGRASDSADQLEIRLGQVQKEVEDRDIYDYLIINDDMETALSDLEAVIRAERMKMSRNESFWTRFLGKRS